MRKYMLCPDEDIKYSRGEQLILCELIWKTIMEREDPVVWVSLEGGEDSFDGPCVASPGDPGADTPGWGLFNGDSEGPIAEYIPEPDARLNDLCEELTDGKQLRLYSAEEPQEEDQPEEGELPS